MADAGMTLAEFEKIKAFAIGFAAKLMAEDPNFKVSIVEFGPVKEGEDGEDGEDGDFWFRLIDLDTGMTEFYFANIYHDDDPRVTKAFKERETKTRLLRGNDYNYKKDLVEKYGVAFPGEVLDETTAINSVRDDAFAKQEKGTAYYHEFTVHTPAVEPAPAPAATAKDKKNNHMKPV